MLTPSDKIAIINGKAQISYRQMLQHVSKFSNQLKCKKGDRILILSENREAWIYSLYSIWASNGIAVPVDASCTADDLAYIINDCNPAAMWVSNSKKDLAADAFKIVGKEIPQLEMDRFESTSCDEYEPAQINICMEDTCVICYTSGTTGSPKGVMLSFGNVYANIEAVSKHVPIFTEERRTLILLPLHHVLPLVGTCVMPLVCGGGVAICSSLSGPRIMEALQNGKVGIMIGVPRLWQMLYKGIKSKIDAKWITRALYNLCEMVQSKTLSRLIFKSVREKMGGQITYLVSGGAALDRDTAVGLKTLGLDVLEGYGMTEAAPMIAFTRPDDIRPGCVGKPILGCEVQIIDGEICARGTNIMQGYYGRPDETKDVIDSEGFLHTGDLGTIDQQGRITITGRRKEIIVLSNGKNVNPVELEEKIEHNSDFVKEAAISFGNDKLVAIIVPSEQISDKGDKEILEILHREVIAPFNQSVAQYKKIARTVLTRENLPRTRMEKLQRFKLFEIINTAIPLS